MLCNSWAEQSENDAIMKRLSSGGAHYCRVSVSRREPTNMEHLADTAMPPIPAAFTRAIAQPPVTRTSGEPHLLAMRAVEQRSARVSTAMQRARQPTTALADAVCINACQTGGRSTRPHGTCESHTLR